MFGQRFVHSVPAGHVGVAILFGEVQEVPYPEGLNIVNPLYSWMDMDVREDTFKISQLDMPTRDQLLSKVDLSIQWRIDKSQAPQIFRETGDKERIVTVHMKPKVRSLIRELGTKIERAEDLFKDEVRDNLANGLTVGLRTYVLPKGIIIDSVLLRNINLPPVLAEAIGRKKEREQEVERQRAELERVKLEQEQQVALADAQKRAAEKEAEMIKILADARAYEISTINKAASGNPAYIQLQSLETLQKMATDPAAKLYFMDSNSPSPLPLMNIGDPITGKR
ncbi:MAG: prohibitin family protein [Proteobacteria bacterium]|nr:prohibitin family protein [Pseudomonadota bacterium]